MASNHKIILISYQISGLMNTIRWSASGFSNNLETVISLKLTTGGPQLDMSFGEEIVIIRNMLGYSNSISIFCFISGYNPHSVISYKFCREDKCLVTLNDGEHPQPVAHDFGKIEADTNTPGLKGMKVTFTFTDNGIDSSGNYYCEASDSRGNFDIRSNNIQIRDTVFWEQNLVMSNDDSRIQDVEDVTRSSLPRTFKCTQSNLKLNPSKPSWINQEFSSPVSWVVCPVKISKQPLKATEKMSFKKCTDFTTVKWKEDDQTLRPRELKEMDNWNYFVNSDGDLNIFHIKEESHDPELSYALMCYTKKNNLAVPISTYVKRYSGIDIESGVIFNGFQSEYTGKIKAISKLEQNVNIFSRKTKTAELFPHVAIYCLYAAPRVAQATWYFKTQPLNNGAFRTIDKYKVNFIGDITSDMEGMYNLAVADNKDQIDMKINVKVIGPPIPSRNCLPLIRHVWEFEGADFTCIYSGEPTEIIMKINKQVIPFNSPLKLSQNSLQLSYPYLSELNFTSTTSKNANTEIATYSVYNLRKTIGQTIYQDHSFMFMAKNDYGMNVKSTSIYTVPRLKNLILVSPETKNCTAECRSSDHHYFQCRIKTDEYLHKELTIDHYWTINSHRLEQKDSLDNQFAPYFQVDPITKDLTLLPISSNNTKRDESVRVALGNNFIQCNLDLIGHTDSVPRFIYYSRNDMTLGNMLKAKITIDYKPINMAYVYWIIAVILVLLILLIMIILLARYCMRNKGETYQLDKIERQHGYDPEKEVQDEIFKPYEREEHELEIMSNLTEERKLSISGHSVGSGDDGELDVYDLDPSNFNEDGSIIGKYGANPRNRAMT